MLQKISLNPQTTSNPPLSGSSNPIVSLKNTKLGTRLAESEIQRPLLSNANATWSNYTRPEEYPNMVTLPSQWIRYGTVQESPFG
jgi:hypothetical protein